MDVFKVEPLPESSALWDCEQLLLTAHNAYYTDDYFELGWSVWTDNLSCFQAGQPLTTPVDLAAGY
jgi:phosphoglycerate dehydrogenase-like enzyme